MKVTEYFAKFISSQELLWKLFYPLVKLGEGLKYQRKLYKENDVKIELNSAFVDLKVRNGVFKNMQYPSFESFGSALYPKLLGSYESELNQYWEKILNINYDEIIDIGSAEGYFTIGFALKHKYNVNVTAVDINIDALNLLKKIAKVNKVDNRITTLNSIDDIKLGEMCVNKRNFILCDTEGYEKELFNKNNISNFLKTDILIETHDSKVLGVSKYLKEIFKNTHKITSIYSIDDIQKFNNYDYQELNFLSQNAKLKALAEGRSNIQEWLFLEPLT